MAEMYDVLDSKGQKTGEVLGRDEVHSKELWHSNVHIWIINSKSEILFQFRSADKKIFPSCWDTSVAGHVDAGETACQAAKREIAEEIGVDINENELQEVGRTTEELPFISGGTHREHNTVFVLFKDFDKQSLKLQKSELQKVRWFTVDEVEEIMHNPIRRKEISTHDDRLVGFVLEAARKP